MAQKPQGTSTKHAQIRTASTHIFIGVAVASVVVSMSLVTLNIMWGTASFNEKVHGKQEEARDTLEQNIEAIKPLQESFQRLEIGGKLIPAQPDDKTNSELILDALPSAYDFPELATTMNNLAESSGVNLLAFRGSDEGSTAQTSAPNPEPVVIPFTVEVEGTYEDVTRFLLNTESSIRPIRVLSMDLTGSSSKLELVMNAETSYQPAFDLTIQKETVTP